MVKTRSQNSKDSVTRSTIITEGVVTRSQKHKHQPQHVPVQKALKKKVLPKVELTDRIKDKIKKRQQCRKQIRQNQTSILNEIHMDANTSKTQNNNVNDLSTNVLFKGTGGLDHFQMEDDF